MNGSSGRSRRLRPSLRDRDAAPSCEHIDHCNNKPVRVCAALDRIFDFGVMSQPRATWSAPFRASQGPGSCDSTLASRWGGRRCCTCPDTSRHPRQSPSHPRQADHEPSACGAGRRRQALRERVVTPMVSIYRAILVIYATGGQVVAATVRCDGGENCAVP